MTNEYLYDGSFDGLLTCLFHAYTDHNNPTITKASYYQPSLLTVPITLLTEDDKVARLTSSISGKLGPDVLRKIYHLYLSDRKGAEVLILDYLKLCYKYGPSVNLAKNNDIIIAVDTLAYKVLHESHRMQGFIRFKEIAPASFYAQIEPDHMIIPLISSHFINRFSNQHFIIHDSRHNMALVYNQKEAFLQSLTTEENLFLIECCPKDDFEDLFRTFYAHTTITERLNPRLHKRLLPIRYWKHLVEVQ